MREPSTARVRDPDDHPELSSTRFQTAEVAVLPQGRAPLSQDHANSRSSRGLSFKALIGECQTWQECLGGATQLRDCTRHIPPIVTQHWKANGSGRVFHASGNVQANDRPWYSRPQCHTCLICVSEAGNPSDRPARCISTPQRIGMLAAPGLSRASTLS